MPHSQSRLEVRAAHLPPSEHFVAASPRVTAALDDADPTKLVAHDPRTAERLRETIARREGVRPENVVLFRGEADALAAIFESSGAGRVAVPDIGWAYYERLATQRGSEVARYAVVREGNAFSTKLDSIPRAGCSLVVLVNPHMPTGHITGRAEILRVARETDAVVLVDQAYEGFSDETPSVVRDVIERENLVVAKTLSKYHGLGSLRVAYVIAHERLATRLTELRERGPAALPYLSALLGSAALDDESYYRAAAREVIASRAALSQRLGDRILRSHANFVLVAFDSREAASDAERALRAAGVIVRAGAEYGLPEFLRVNIETRDVAARIAAILVGPDSGVRLADAS